MKRKPKVLKTGWIRMEKATGHFPFVMYKTKHEAQETFANFWAPKEWKAVRVELRVKP